jgi:hypothetical protein
VFAISDGSLPARRSGAAGVRCTLHDLAAAGGEGVAPGALAGTPIEGDTYFVVCGFPTGAYLVRQIVYRPGVNVVDAGTLARQAFRMLPLSHPRPSTAPPDGQLVGVRTWLWIDPDDYRTVTASVDVPGLEVTATATPQRVRWQMGSPRDEVRCDGPGTPYSPSRGGAAQHTPCSYVFQRSGAVPITVYIDWVVTWQASDGTSGVLPPLSRGTSFVAPVEQRQAVIND